MENTFICNAKECPNEAIVYVLQTENKQATCGGCYAILEAQPVKEEN